MAKASEKAPLDYIFTPFDERELWKLDRFARKVREMKATRFMAGKPGLKAKSVPGATYLGGPAWSLSNDGAAQEDIKALSGDFRQCWAPSEKTSATKLIEMLRRHAARRKTDASAEMVRWLSDYEGRLECRAEADPRGAMLDEMEGQIAPSKIVESFLHGEYLHPDYEKAQFVGDGDEGAAPAMMGFSLEMTLRDFVHLWDELAAIAETIVADPRMHA